VVKRQKRGWEVELQDGTILQEGKIEWKKVPKRYITRLSLFYDGRVWNLTGKEAYFVKYRASVVPGVKESFRIETRIIGYYEGSNKICYTVDEGTGNFEIKVINTNG